VRGLGKPGATEGAVFPLLEQEDPEVRRKGECESKAVSTSHEDAISPVGTEGKNSLEHLARDCPLLASDDRVIRGEEIRS
jgi:hypothetical protein